MQILNLLRQTRLLIDTPAKWCTGQLISYDNKHCVRGALNMASSNDPLQELDNDHPAIMTLIETIPTDAMEAYEQFYDQCGSEKSNREAIAFYNNNATHDVVLAWLDRAIEKIGHENRQAVIDSLKKIVPELA